MRPRAEFPAAGLGPGEGRGDKAVRVIKFMCKHSIETSIMDVAGAVDGSRPLETLADSCGYGWGSTRLQMSIDLTRFRVLLMAGKGLTPAQQAWSPLILEA